ncbi:MAG: hypothetical protein H7Y03_07105 [Chitinophagaceae bacterium]|nr:hypothetical protein [Chitinophagaceae bacterium]
MRGHLHSNNCHRTAFNNQDIAWQWEILQQARNMLKAKRAEAPVAE